MRVSFSRSLAVISGLALLVPPALAAEPGWKDEGGRDGVTLESRPVEGSHYFEYRARTDSSEGAEALCKAVFEWASVGRDHVQLKDRRLLEDTGDFRLVHDKLEAPMVANRELTFGITKRHLENG